MLSSIQIKNIAIIESLEIDFDQGLNVMTGETGAGKTIIVQTLALVLGAKAQQDIIRTGESEAAVSAVFHIDDSLPNRRLIREELESAGVDIEGGEVIIRRVLNASGKGKISINGFPVTLQTLKKVAGFLVDISSQHENQLLLDPSNHAGLIDDFGGYENLLDEYKKCFDDFHRIQSELNRLKADALTSKERLEFMKFQLDELKKASPEKGELERLEENYKRLKNSKVLESSAREASETLYDAPQSVAELLGRVSMSLTTAGNYDPKLAKWGEIAGRCAAELHEVARDAREYAENIGEETQDIEAIEDRMHLLKGLVRKHGSSLDDVIAKIETLEEEIGRFENNEELTGQMEVRLEESRKNLISKADELSKARRKAGDHLVSEVGSELKGLAMGKVAFRAEIERRGFDEWDGHGPDRVEFFISPNVGEALRPLSKTASGGELSRIMLALKRVLSDKAGLASTYVFDEVDSGIGGATAGVVGKKLFEVAGSRQVICITHLPQVACFGSSHYRIDKKVEKGRTRTDVIKVEKAQRVDEIARMLGGAAVSDISKKHAEELLNSAVNYKTAR